MSAVILAGSPTASTAASGNALAAKPSPGVTTRSARRRSAEAAAQAAAGGIGAKSVTPPTKQAKQTAAVDGREAWQQLLQSPQHAALLQRPPFHWLPPPTSQLQQQQQSSAADADAEMRTAPALPAEAWQVGYGPVGMHMLAANGQHCSVGPRTCLLQLDHSLMHQPRLRLSRL